MWDLLPADYYVSLDQVSIMIMKKIVFTSLLTGFLLVAGLWAVQGCGVLSETPAEKAARLAKTAAYVRQAVQAEEFKVEITQMIPMRGTVQQVSPFSLTLKDGVLNSHLPYVGRAWEVPYGGGHALNFEFPIQEYRLISEQEGVYTVRILVKTDEDTHVYTLNLTDEGYASLVVQSRNREPVSYNGMVVLPEE